MKSKSTQLKEYLRFRKLQEKESKIKPKKSLYYIGRRDNPQNYEPYYILFDRLTEEESIKRQECLYGTITLTSYKTRLEYNQAIEKLKVNNCYISNL